MKEYVLCIMFDRKKEQVCLIEKINPLPQRGLYNFPGGKIEGLETSKKACVREFKEETGVFTTVEEWDKFAVLTFPNEEAVIHCFRAATNLVNQAKTVEKEIVKVVNIKDVHNMPTVGHLEMLLFLALDENVINAQIMMK